MGNYPTRYIHMYKSTFKLSSAYTNGALGAVVPQKNGIYNLPYPNING